MIIQPVDLPSLLRAALWPVVGGIAIIIFRQQVIDLVKLLSERINKFSFGGVSLELAVLPEMRSAALEIEVRQLNAAPQIQSGVQSISGIFDELQRREDRGYIVVDLGSEAAPRWLTSRLYMLAFLITLIDRPIPLVFVETVGELRKRFVGAASANSMRWALARRYSWLESAMAAAYAVAGGTFCAPNAVMQVPGVSSFQFDPATGHLASANVSQLMQNFLANIRVLTPGPPAQAADEREWIALSNGMVEHSRWLNGRRIERLLGQDLSASSVVLAPNQSVDSLDEVIIAQQGASVAILEMDRSFRTLVDRCATLDSLGSAFLKQRRAVNQNARRQ
jgi:hypothetical protein